MDATTTSEQEALRSVVRDLVREVIPPRRFAEAFDVERAENVESRLWSRLADLGLLGLSVPERLGGAGAGLAEESILLAESGAGLLPAPVFSTVALCLPLLCAAEQAEELVPAVLEGRRRYALGLVGEGATSLLDPDVEVSVRAAEAPAGAAAQLTGKCSWVLDAEGADALIVAARVPCGIGVYLVDPSAVAGQRHLAQVDASRGAAEIKFDRTPAHPLLDPDRAAPALAAVRRRGTVLALAEAVGLTRTVLHSSVEYVKARTQFGRPIGGFQGVSHQLADVYVDLQLGESLLQWAVSDTSDTAAHAAASRVLPAAARACERAIQLHGGIGMTWDAPLHRYYKRALVLQALLPRTSQLRRQVADRLLGPGLTSEQ